MSPRSKKEHTETTYLRYKNASRREKKKILDEYCAGCDCRRKHAIRKLRSFKRFTKPREKKRGKPTVYQPEELISVRLI